MGTPDYVQSAFDGMTMGQMARKNRAENKERENQKKLKDLYSSATTIGEDGRVSVDESILTPGLIELAPKEAISRQQRADKKKASMEKSKQVYRDKLSGIERDQNNKDRMFDLQEKQFNERRDARLAKQNKAAGPEKIKGDQYKVGGFAKRAIIAEEELAKLPEDIGTSGITDTLQGWSFMPEAMKSQDRKSFEQTQRNFISAVLRRESGAAISDQEMENESMKYFPQPGDGSRVLAQKKRARQQAVLNLKSEAGGPLEKIASAPEQAIRKEEVDIPGVKNAFASSVSHPQASAAEKWAKANPNDPRAKTILERLGR
jgi:hypothetical protein